MTKVIFFFNSAKHAFKILKKPIHLYFQAGSSGGLLMDLAANEKSVHADFFNGKLYLFFSFFSSYDYIWFSFFQILKISLTMKMSHKVSSLRVIWERST